MAKSVARRLQAANRTITVTSVNAEISPEGVAQVAQVAAAPKTLAQLVAEKRGTTTQGSNIASNLMYEQLTKSPSFTGATRDVQKMMLSDLLTKLPNDNAAASVRNVINMMLQ